MEFYSGGDRLGSTTAWASEDFEPGARLQGNAWKITKRKQQW